MKYDIIFYISKKTSYCEKSLKRAMTAIGGETYSISDATSPTALGEKVASSLRRCPLTVIVGGLRSFDDDNLAVVLSRVFSNSTLTLDNMRKITAENGEVGYIIRCKNQILLALPDDPDTIEMICSERLMAFIKEKTAVE